MWKEWQICVNITNLWTWVIPANTLGEYFSLKVLYAGIKCRNLGVLVNGNISPDLLEYAALDTVYFTCKNGYKLLGKSSSVCQLDGTFSNVYPKCQSLFLSAVYALNRNQLLAFRRECVPESWSSNEWQSISWLNGIQCRSKGNVQL